MLLGCHRLSKSYSGAAALCGVDLKLQPGEVHGLVGANGAGKSTLVKILSGAITDYEGTVTLDGRPIRMAGPREAIAHGISTVYQELSGVGQLSVAENLFLGRQVRGRFGLLSWRAMRRHAAEVLQNVGLEIDVTRRLDSFSLSVRQLIEIARCLDTGSRVLILDEPTSALSPPESQRLFQLIKRLRDMGKTVVFVSHFIEDVLQFCDNVTILVSGRLHSTRPAREMTKHEIIHAMLGGGDPEIEASAEGAMLLPEKSERPAVIEGRGLSRRGCFSGIDLAVHEAECLGLYGFVGAGHQELAHSLAGALRPDGGEIDWRGTPARLASPARAVRLGIALVAADRGASLVPNAEIYKNVTLARLGTMVGTWMNRKREIAAARPFIDRVNCRPGDPCLPAGSLSGGNQQKVVIAKWLPGPIKLLILEEPTRGMDVGAKAEIMGLVRELKGRGVAVILASSEPELILSHADRILVLRRGAVSREFSACEVDQAALMRFA